MDGYPSNREAVPRVGWRERLWVAYLRGPHHKGKRFVEEWLWRALRIKRVQVAIPGPAVLDMRTGQYLTKEVARAGGYERTTLERVINLCRGASCFLDVGGHWGQYTLAVSAVLPPDGRVVTVEPNPENYIELCRNLQLNHRGNVYPVLAAASDAPGLLRLESPVAADTGNTRTTREMKAGEMIVPAVCLAELLNRLGVARVDVMKIDVEGFEPAALRGLFANEALKPRHIIFEYYPPKFPTADETVAMLRDAGYKLQQVTGEPFDPAVEPLDYNLWATLS